jgi:hypothetical protein
MAAGYSAASPAAQQAMLADLATALAQFAHKEGLRVPFRSYLAAGYKEPNSKVKRT